MALRPLRGGSTATVTASLPRFRQRYGWPIHDCLKVTFNEKSRGIIVSPVTFWKASDMPLLTIDAALTLTATDKPINMVVEIVPCEGKCIPYPVSLPPDGTRQTYTLPLHSHPAYTGAMKQVTVSLPHADGSLRLYAITGDSKKR